MILERDKKKFVASLVALSDKVSSKSFSGAPKEQEQALINFFKETNERFAATSRENLHI
ncbi:TPA: hypothetical protein J1442_000903 [Escherichia coli]|uniref:hypothetical protein n=1 Tax=Escherichia coli TaxID=562 RepID=UPI000A67A151|nr:hypothetical protein [Escherichia coli]EEC0821829.1 hypothetical protein [Salmonella enterica subsp. enterica serovar Aberdeen]EEQ3929374.1 hypothetical protein [Escherichia coli]EEQ9665623.1 hypothetical protein [Escherichia coli]EEW0061359.1 hypothetical protein [Escherichia coli]EFA1705602.1 hypothetical protein [Escherichia coli]